MSRPSGERARSRSVYFSPYILAVAVTSAFLQVQYPCEIGNTRLASLEVEVFEVDQVTGFDPSTLDYDVTTTAGSIVVRAETEDQSASSFYQLRKGGALLAAGPLGIGGGEVTLDVPRGTTDLKIEVRPPEGGFSFYDVDIERLEGLEKEITLGCANSTPLDEELVLRARLRVSTLSATPGSDFTATLSGAAFFPERYLDAVQFVLQGGVREIEVLDLRYVVQVRSGALGPDVPLGLDVASVTPGEVLTCDIPFGALCATDADCLNGVGSCNPVIRAEIPISEDCAPGGLCDTLGKATDPGSQCALNDFCVTGDLELPLAPAQGVYTAGSSGPVLFGWADMGLGNNTLDPNTGLYTIPKPDAFGPIEQGSRADVALTLAFECVMAVDAGPKPGNANSRLIAYTPDDRLIAVPVE